MMTQQERLWISAQAGLDTFVYVETIAYTFTLGAGVATLSPGLVMTGQVMKMGTQAVDAMADAMWDRHTGGCRSEQNADKAAWHVAKSASGANPLSSAALDVYRALTSGIGSAWNNLNEDCEYYTRL